MRVEREHRIDASEPDQDGSYAYYYDYDMYRFVEGDLALVARSYRDEPHRISFLSKQRRGRAEPLDAKDLRSELARQALAQLAAEGKSEFSWFDEERGYVAMDGGAAVGEDGADLPQLSDQASRSLRAATARVVSRAWGLVCVVVGIVAILWTSYLLFVENVERVQPPGFVIGYLFGISAFAVGLGRVRRSTG